jgi:sRNA-binding protein
VRPGCAAQAEKAEQEAKQQEEAEEAARAAGKDPPKPKPPAKEDRIAIARTMGRKAPVKYYVTGGRGGQGAQRAPCCQGGHAARPWAVMRC